MQEIISLLLIGFSLSMDSFSLALSLGMNIYNIKRLLFFCVLVGIFHFIMPIIGFSIGNQIISIISINSKLLLSAILILIAIDMLISLIKNVNDNISKNYITLLLLALVVSLDSFATGLGINAITSNHILAGCIFSSTAFFITMFGIFLGKYSKLIIGKYANIIGIIILFAISLINIIFD